VANLYGIMSEWQIYMGCQSGKFIWENVGVAKLDIIKVANLYEIMLEWQIYMG
jgi:hypothetical protein